jgi:hydroxypyruvate reductase
MDVKELRRKAIDIFESALRSSRVEPAMERRVRVRDGVLEVDELRYELRRYGRVFVVAIGKAAGPMAAAFLRQAGAEAARFEGIVAGFHDSGDWPLGFRLFRSGHPSPNEVSVEAARAILAALQGLGEDDLVVFLMSGGGSSMVELFSDAAIPLESMAATHRALVECGAPIAAMNAVRKHLSSVKGGRLAAAAWPARQLTIFVSDVPVSELDALASGPTLPDRSTVEDVYGIAEKYGLTDRLPAGVREMVVERRLAETPKAGGAIFARSNWSVLLDSASLEETAAARARELGWHVEVDNRCDDWTAEDASKYLVGRVGELRRSHDRVCLLSAGEITVRIPSAVSGKGGRNSHFALLCSELISGGGMTVLSGGSDGIDGHSPAAGAVVDGTTVARAEETGYPVAAALAAFDSYTLLEKLGDAVVTGPTGNNLRDLRVLLLD